MRVVRLARRVHLARLARLARRVRLVASVVAVIVAVSAHVPAAAADAELFDALGGKPGIDRLVDDLVPRLARDERIGRFFEKTDLAELNKQLGDQLCAVAGGPCRYEGADMKAAHADLGIAKADFNRMVEVLQASMDARSIPFATQNRLLARLAPMHRDVIGQR